MSKQKVNLRQTSFKTAKGRSLASTLSDWTLVHTLPNGDPMYLASFSIVGGDTPIWNFVRDIDDARFWDFGQCQKLLSLAKRDMPNVEMAGMP